MKRIRVLLADDTDVARAGWTVLLQEFPDIEIVGSAATQLEAIRLAKELLPDVILIDIKWKGDPFAGQVAIREIKRVTDSKVRIIALTAHEELITAAKAAGADIAQSKDFTMDGIVSLIRDLAIMTDNLPRSTVENTPLDMLSDREKEVLVLMAAGDRNREIGVKLSLSENTVKNYVKKILEKLEVDTRGKASNLAIKYGLVKK